MVNQAKTIKILAFAIYIAIGNTVSGLAQDRKDVVSYLKDSGPLSTLMRGQKPAQYTFLYNGTPYIESPEFKKGDLRYNGRTYFGVLLNIDAAAMDALVKTDANVAATATLRRQTAWLKIENRLFVNLEFLEVEMAPEGYCEVVLDGETPIVKFVTKTLRTQTGNHNGKDIGMNDPEYREDVRLKKIMKGVIIREMIWNSSLLKRLISIRSSATVSLHGAFMKEMHMEKARAGQFRQSSHHRRKTMLNAASLQKTQQR